MSSGHLRSKNRTKKNKKTFLSDPEEFLHCLLSQTLKAEPFLKLSSGQEAYHHQLFVEKDDKLVMPTVQQLFEQSFLSSGIKLKEVIFYKFICSFKNVVKLLYLLTFLH